LRRASLPWIVGGCTNTSHPLAQRGKNGGQFYSPVVMVRLALGGDGWSYRAGTRTLVRLGGMFVQSEKVRGKPRGGRLGDFHLRAGEHATPASWGVA